MSKLATIAIVISGISLLIATFTLGWNIYRDIILKPRLKVRYGIYRMHRPEQQPSPPKVILGATNFGPGKIRISAINGKCTSLWRMIIRKVKHSFIIHDYKNPESGKLPAVLDVGESIDLIFPYEYEKGTFLDAHLTNIGLRDSFGKVHWAPKKKVKEVRREYLKDFALKTNNNKATS